MPAVLLTGLQESSLPEMPPAIVTATLQSATLSALSNILAQGISAYRSEVGCFYYVY